MHKFLLLATVGTVCCYGGNAVAKTTFLPDWQMADLEFQRDEPLCQDAVDKFGNKLYHKASGCPAPKVFDEHCAHDDRYISECYCPAHYQYNCVSPYRGDERVKKNGYASCDGLYIACCDGSCPGNTSKSNPGGCGGSTTNDCGDTCYYPYQPCCYPSPSETGCTCGSYSCSDGCGGTRTCCSSCPTPPPASSSSSSSSSGSSSSGSGSSGSSSSGSSGSSSSGGGSSSGNNPWVRYYKVKGNKNWYCADKNAMYAVWGCNPSDGRYCITKDGEYMPNCEVELGCYNKDTGEYKYKETKPYGAMWNGGKTFDSKAACDASGFDCIADDSYTGAWTHTTNTPCNSDGTTESFW